MVIMPLFCQLNIYAPLAQSAQAQAVPDQPGVVQRGITTARESIQPFVQASKVFPFNFISVTHFVQAKHLCAAITTAETAMPGPQRARLRYCSNPDLFSCRMWLPRSTILSGAKSQLQNFCTTAKSSGVQQEVVVLACHTLQRDVTV